MTKTMLLEQLVKKLGYLLIFLAEKIQIFRTYEYQNDKPSFESKVA